MPVVFKGERVAELAADGSTDPAFFERVALLVSPYCVAGPNAGAVPPEEVP